MFVDGMRLHAAIHAAEKALEPLRVRTNKGHDLTGSDAISQPTKRRQDTVVVSHVTQLDAQLALAEKRLPETPDFLKNKHA